MVKQLCHAVVTAFGRTPRGQALVMVTIMIMVLIAFVALATDTGLIWLNRRGLQNSADAAALAGAQDLNPLDSTADAVARQFACDYAGLNNVEDMTIDCSGAGGSRAEDCNAQPNVDVLICRTYVAGDTIRVTTHKTVAPVFGAAVGFSDVDVAARATAIIGSIDAACIVPLFQTQDLLEASGVWGGSGVELNTQTVMKTSADGSSSGNFLALQVDGSSSKDDWKDAMSDPTRCSGDDPPMVQGTATTNPGNFAGPFDQAMAAREEAWLAQGTCGGVQEATQYLADDGKLRYGDGTELTPENCYRMVKIPMLAGSVEDYTGSEKTVEIVGFLVFYMSNWCGQNSTPQVQAGYCDPPAGITDPLQKSELWGYYVGYSEAGVDVHPYDGLGTEAVMLIE